MQVIEQSIDEILKSLSPLDVDWMDDMATATIAKLSDIEKKEKYDRSDLEDLFSGSFDVGLLCARLFLIMSKDKMDEELRRTLGPGGAGSKRMKSSPDQFFGSLEKLGLLEAMATAINHRPVWSDILVERLRAGRGSAISGQKRGRGLEDVVESLVSEVFGENGYEVRCTFTGAGGRTAKCDIAIPNRDRPRIILEVKGYGATGSKMSDIIGDLDAIIEAKRHDTTLLFFTDGTTWAARVADLRKIIDRQNDGKIARIYTTNMREQLIDDLKTLKSETGL
ncbi:DpnII family type II restriction endonuclease [Stappia sp. TSB10GB4]|uniref:DpnII family type II restriction endonuclease n=1 Tax=Stappia sp. TSB10GB4 TaxID=2003584 RepID=UPI001646DE5B|nr:DpnII family type II restriction endonuclease [Stappia sp. TSB10GB4]